MNSGIIVQGFGDIEKIVHVQIYKIEHSWYFLGVHQKAPILATEGDMG